MLTYFMFLAQHLEELDETMKNLRYVDRDLISIRSRYEAELLTS